MWKLKYANLRRATRPDPEELIKGRSLEIGQPVGELAPQLPMGATADPAILLSNDPHPGVFVTVGLLAKISPVYFSQAR